MTGRESKKIIKMELHEKEEVRSLTSGAFIVACLSSTFGFIITTAYLTFNIYHRNKRFMKMSSPNLNVMISTGGLMLNCACLMYGIEFFFRFLYTRTSVICQMRLWVVTIGVTMLFGPMFLKSWRVYQIFKNAGIKRVIIRDKHLFMAMALLLLIDVFILSLWQGIDPPTSRPVPVLLQSTSKGSNFSYVLVQECVSSTPEVWVPLILVIKSAMMASGLFLAWKTKHVMLPAMRDSACIVTSILTTMFLISQGLMLSSSLRHTPDAVCMIYVLIVTGFSSVVQNAVFYPKVKFYWKSTLEQQMRMSVSTHELQHHLPSTEQYEEEMIQLVNENATLKKSLTQKNSTIQQMERHLQNAKRTLRRMTADREGKIDSGLDMSSSTLNDDDMRAIVRGSREGNISEETQNSNTNLQLSMQSCDSQEVGNDFEPEERDCAKGGESRFRSISRQVSFNNRSQPQELQSSENCRFIAQSCASCNSAGSLGLREGSLEKVREEHEFSIKTIENAESTPDMVDVLKSNETAKLRYSLRRAGRNSFRSRLPITEKHKVHELLHLKEEVDADLTHAQFLSSSLRNAISVDLDNINVDNNWVAESMKSRQDIVGSLARCYDIEDNSDTLSFVTNYIPCKLPRRKLDNNTMGRNTPVYVSSDSVEPLTSDRVYPTCIKTNQGECVNMEFPENTGIAETQQFLNKADPDDINEVHTKRLNIRDPNRLVRNNSIRTPRKALFTKYLVSEVTTAPRSYYL